jgi:biopolymer transport protein ExbD
VSADVSVVHHHTPAEEEDAENGNRGRRQIPDGAIAGVNIVPVIDLCLVLLVVLLIVSPLLEHAPVEVKLPTAKTQAEKENNIAVTLAPDGRLALNTDEVKREDLPKLLRMMIREQGDDVLVILRSDKDVQYGELTKILKIAKEAGARKISLGTEQRKDNP